MTGKDQSGLEWRDGIVPVSRRFDDPYFSLADGLAETRHVFLAGNDLPARLAPGFHIAELGFGTGLNLLATLIAWRAAGAPTPLHFTSFEAFPLSSAEIARALTAFPEALAVAGPFLQAWQTGEAEARAQGFHAFDLDGLQVRVILGDVAESLPAWPGRADAWYLDGFSPAKNPQMWAPAVLQGVADHTAPGGSFATYTAAGFVRRALAEAGFTVSRRPGHGRKRHMSCGQMTKGAR